MATKETAQRDESKYKSVPILFLFLVIEGNPEICNSWLFEPAILIGNHTLVVKIDTLDINFLKAQLSFDKPV